MTLKRGQDGLGGLMQLSGSLDVEKLLYIRRGKQWKKSWEGPHIAFIPLLFEHVINRECGSENDSILYELILRRT